MTDKERSLIEYRLDEMTKLLAEHVENFETHTQNDAKHFGRIERYLLIVGSVTITTLVLKFPDLLVVLKTFV